MKAQGEDILLTIQFLIDRWGMLGLLASGNKGKRGLPSLSKKIKNQDENPFNSPDNAFPDFCGTNRRDRTTNQ